MPRIPYSFPLKFPDIDLERSESYAVRLLNGENLYIDCDSSLWQENYIAFYVKEELFKPKFWIPTAAIAYITNRRIGK